MQGRTQGQPRRHSIITVLGDPGPLPELAEGEGQLERMAYWSEQVALRHRQFNFAADLAELEAECLALLIAIQQFQAAQAA